MVPIPVSRGPQGLHSLELSLKPICRCPSLANCTPCPTPLSNYRGRYPPTVSTWEVMVNVAGEPWPPPSTPDQGPFPSFHDQRDQAASVWGSGLSPGLVACLPYLRLGVYLPCGAVSRSKRVWCLWMDSTQTCPLVMATVRGWVPSGMS